MWPFYGKWNRTISPYTTFKFSEIYENSIYFEEIFAVSYKKIRFYMKTTFPIPHPPILRPLTLPPVVFVHDEMTLFYYIEISYIIIDGFLQN